jgi:hypothetical protein
MFALTVVFCFSWTRLSPSYVVALLPFGSQQTKVVANPGPIGHLDQAIEGIVIVAGRAPWGVGDGHDPACRVHRASGLLAPGDQ